MIELKFVNSDARPKVTAIRCDTASMAPVMAWYGAFYAGDRYAVYADGEKLPKDRNGELITPRDRGLKPLVETAGGLDAKHESPGAVRQSPMRRPHSSPKIQSRTKQRLKDALQMKAEGKTMPEAAEILDMKCSSLRALMIRETGTSSGWKK